MLLSLLRFQLGLSIDLLTQISPTDLHTTIGRAKGMAALGSRSP
jgi:hypothetical protein